MFAGDGPIHSATGSPLEKGENTLGRMDWVGGKHVNLWDIQTSEYGCTISGASENNQKISRGCAGPSRLCGN
jgi:hypothetical protein